ncbi:NADH-quinone oxidoreductase subunit J [Bacillus massiliglaciei]|uniref:NADH-quinone oxidoreductase subunit J n=1 Tax=Bacillus massiliglaciei TaxID=1816693 RepID=UPI000DA5F3F8|nr:NADH-quinone oxidoreductase subunit J [Bacillus massiliglaciei]
MGFSGEMIAFSILAFLTVTGAVMLLQVKRWTHVVITLAVTIISIAGIFVLLSAEFAALVQILIGLGVVISALMFRVKLAGRSNNEASKTGKWKKFFLAAGVAGFSIAVYAGIHDLNISVLPSDFDVKNTKKLGIELFSKYMIPLGLTLAVLLSAFAGILFLTKEDSMERSGRS